MSQLRATAMYGSAVLLEEHPLQHLRAIERIGRDVLRPVGEVPEDRARLAERPSVLEDGGWHPQAGIQIAEDRLAVRLVDDGERPALVLDGEERKEEPHLVAVARDRGVVEDD